jgi:hypothetical protein
MPLLGMLLRGYFIDGKPKQDQLIVSRLRKEERIPLPLIAMGVVLVRFTFHLFPASNNGADWPCFAGICIGIQDGEPPVDSEFGWPVSHLLASR